jgi:iron complex transport system permease protein
MSAIITLSDAAELRSAVLWLLGGFGLASGAVAVFGVYAWHRSPCCSQARGRSTWWRSAKSAQYLGADVERVKRRVYLSTAALTGRPWPCRVSWLRRARRPTRDASPLGPAASRATSGAFLAGGAFLVLADVIARTTFRPRELPVGVVTALVGVPVFALLLRRKLA